MDFVSEVKAESLAEIMACEQSNQVYMTTPITHEML